MKKYTPKYFDQFSIKNINYYYVKDGSFYNEEFMNFLFVVCGFFPICEGMWKTGFCKKSQYSLSVHDIIIENKFLMKRVYIF